jgi:hypothetical protein
MKNALKNILFILLIGITFQLKAQTNMAFYPIENQFNSFNFNPAFLTSKGQFSFSIFPFAGTNIGYNNQEEIQSLARKLLSGINEDVEYIDLVKSMVRRPTFYQKAENEWLSFTYRSRIGFFNFRIMESLSLSASVKGPVSEFMILPEVRSVALNQVQHIPALFIHFREYSIGYSLPPDHHKLTAGIRGKLYFGKGVFSSEVEGSVQHLADTTFLKTWGNGKMSIPEETVQNNDGTTSSVPGINSVGGKNYFMNAGNPGIGLDLGMKYQYNQKLSFSMSIIDFGKIFWKTNLNSKRFDGKYNFKNSSFARGFQNDIEIISKTSDSISFSDPRKNKFRPTNISSRFSTTLPLTIYAGLKYQMNPDIALNLVHRSVIIKDLNYQTYSLIGNFELNKKLTLTTGYSIISDNYNNIPLTILLHNDLRQIYLGTDNLLSFLAPSASKFSGLSFGTCIYLFRKRNLYDPPTKEFPYRKVKKVKKVKKTGRILNIFPDFK